MIGVNAPSVQLIVTDRPELDGFDIKLIALSEHRVCGAVRVPYALLAYLRKELEKLSVPTAVPVPPRPGATTDLG